MGGIWDWQEARRSRGWWPYSRSLETKTGATTHSCYDDQDCFVGINFASQDYLGLTTHPSVREAATDALQHFGPHSAGSPTLMGNTALHCP